jgi:hypothetical protein
LKATVRSTAGLRAPAASGMTSFGSPCTAKARSIAERAACSRPSVVVARLAALVRTAAHGRPVIMVAGAACTPSRIATSLTAFRRGRRRLQPHARAPTGKRTRSAAMAAASAGTRAAPCVTTRASSLSTMVTATTVVTALITAIALWGQTVLIVRLGVEKARCQLVRKCRNGLPRPRRQPT